MVISFLAPDYLGLLLVLPALVLVLLVTRSRRRVSLRRFAQPHLLPRLVSPTPGWVATGAPLLALTAAGLVLVALARPQTGTDAVRLRARQVDLILAIDLSTSMRAPDVAPNRLEAAKRAGLTLIENLSGERIGIMGFAGDAFLACPLTTDYGSARMFLDALDPSFLSQPGTSLARASDVAASSFPEESAGVRAVVVLSDGEDHEGGVREMVRELSRQGIRVYCLGVGTTDGELIPADAEATDYKRDSEGRPVLSRLNEESLARLALGTGGTYHRLGAGAPAVEAILDRIRSLPAPMVERTREVQGVERFQIPLGAAALCLALSLSARAVRPRQPVPTRREP